jgi:hypothetical protein
MGKTTLSGVARTNHGPNGKVVNPLQFKPPPPSPLTLRPSPTPSPHPYNQVGVLHPVTASYDECRHALIKALPIVSEARLDSEARLRVLSGRECSVPRPPPLLPSPPPPCTLLVISSFFIPLTLDLIRPAPPLKL